MTVKWAAAALTLSFLTASGAAGYPLPRRGRMIIIPPLLALPLEGLLRGLGQSPPPVQTCPPDMLRRDGPDLVCALNTPGGSPQPPPSDDGPDEDSNAPPPDQPPPPETPSAEAPPPASQTAPLPALPAALPDDALLPIYTRKPLLVVSHAREDLQDIAGKCLRGRWDTDPCIKVQHDALNAFGMSYSRILKVQFPEDARKVREACTVQPPLPRDGQRRLDLFNQCFNALPPGGPAPGVALTLALDAFIFCTAHDAGCGEKEANLKAYIGQKPNKKAGDRSPALR